MAELWDFFPLDCSGQQTDGAVVHSSVSHKVTLIQL